MRLLICLISFSFLGCKATFPARPVPTIYQPVSIQTCHDGVCKQDNYCNVWNQIEEEWVLIEETEWKNCSGIFGVNADDFIKIRDFENRVRSWIKINCTSSDIEDYYVQ